MKAKKLLYSFLLILVFTSCSSSTVDYSVNPINQDLINEKVSLRTNEMLNDGAIKEAKRFYKLRIKKDLSSNKVIGLNEIKEYLDKRINLNELKEKISIKTRQYAKRQSTWARGQMSDWQKIKFNRLKSFLKKFPKSA